MFWEKKAGWWGTNHVSLIVGIFCCVHLVGCDSVYDDSRRVLSPSPQPCAGSRDGGCDGDGDGVSDDADRCPHSLADVYVDDSGCVYDSDADGVSNPFDRCPDSPPGANVDSSGCSR